MTAPDLAQVTEVLDKAVLDIDVSTTTDEGVRLSQSVTLTLRDFSLQSIQALAYWEEIDPDAYEEFTKGDVAVESFASSAVKLRNLLYAVVRSKVTDRRLRETVTVGDFDVAATDLSAMVGAIEDLKG